MDCVAQWLALPDPISDEGAGFTGEVSILHVVKRNRDHGGDDYVFCWIADDDLEKKEKAKKVSKIFKIFFFILFNGPSHLTILTRGSECWG